MGFDYAAKIRALLAKADGEEALGNDGAGGEFRAKAQEWMNRYKIAEESVLAEDPAAAEPTFLKIQFQPRDVTLAHFYVGMIRVLTDHTEVRYHLNRITWTSYEVTVVGYEGDVRYFEFLWTSAFLMFTTKIDPRWNSDLTKEENIFYLRQAGFKRKDIADMAGWDGSLAANRSKVQRIYMAEAKRRGETAAATGLGFQAKDYREAYARGFNDQLDSRLRRARDAANATGGVVVLAGRAERVAEAFYTMFPAERPTSGAAERPTSGVQVEYVAPNADCNRCKKAKTVCRQHSYLVPRKWTQTDERRWQNQQHGASARAGRATGQMAAEGVLLRGTASPKAQRVEAANQALEG